MYSIDVMCIDKKLLVFVIFFQVKDEVIKVGQIFDVLDKVKQVNKEFDVKIFIIQKQIVFGVKVNVVVLYIILGSIEFYIYGFLSMIELMFVVNGLCNMYYLNIMWVFDVDMEDFLYKNLEWIVLLVGVGVMLKVELIFLFFKGVKEFKVVKKGYVVMMFFVLIDFLILLMIIGIEKLYDFIKDKK